MRDIKFKYVMKTNDRVKVSKAYPIEKIDDIACMFEEVCEDFMDDCIEIGHTSSDCDCFDDFYHEGELIDRIQYTGVTDKNSVEIYEGDIVKAQHSDEYGYVTDTFMNGASTGLVRWGGYYPAFDIYEKHPTSASGYSSISDEYNVFSCDEWIIEIIGNIYENPELLPIKDS